MALVVAINSFTCSSFLSGEDFEATEIRLVFAPDVFALPVPLRIINDAVPEPPEMFQLNLFQVVESPTVFLDTNRAEITINDEDGELLNTPFLLLCITHST